MVAAPSSRRRVIGVAPTQPGRRTEVHYCSVIPQVTNPLVLCLALRSWTFALTLSRRSPGSEELWSPRWSPDGRYILAISRARDRLMLFEVNSQKWAELAKISVNWPQWSRKGDYIYFVGRPTVDQPTGVFRVRIRDRKLEQVISLKDFRHAPDDWGWLGLTPDDSPLLLRDTTTQDIYALDWEAP